MSNNAIQNSAGLGKADKHNSRKYDNDKKNIEIIRGTSSLYDDVKDLYKYEFEESLLEYNSKQTRDDRKIKDYFTHVSNDSKSDLACEIIVQLGDKKYWDTKDMTIKRKMTNIFLQQVKDLENLVPSFKIANAIIHYDETSPHLHIIGIPIKYKNKYGLSKQVGKSTIFTKESLNKIQDKMRILCIESFNKEYNTDYILNQKLKGRNKDIHVDDMTNYQDMKKELENNQNNLEKANKKSLELDNNSKEVKTIINNLKTSKLNKDNYILNINDKDKLISFINQVENINNDYKNIQKLSVTLKDVGNELVENRKQIKILTENNNALNLRVDSLTKKVNFKDNEITELREENNSLKKMLQHWKSKFFSIIHFLKDRIIRNKDRDKYMDFLRNLYTHGALDTETMNDIKNDYDYSVKSKSNKIREKDDYER
jgi:Plasmid recombination enzyme.